MKARCPSSPIFILSLCELIVGGKDGLQPVQKTIIDRCVRLVYQDYLNDPPGRKICRFWRTCTTCCALRTRRRPQYIATALEIYVTGSLNVFNHRSNVNVHNRIVCYDIKELGKQLKKSGCWLSRIRSGTASPSTGRPNKSTRYYI